jgi:hypothetical protein
MAAVVAEEVGTSLGPPPHAGAVTGGAAAALPGADEDSRQGLEQLQQRLELLGPLGGLAAPLIAAPCSRQQSEASCGDGGSSGGVAAMGLGATLSFPEAAAAAPEAAALAAQAMALIARRARQLRHRLVAAEAAAAAAATARDVAERGMAEEASRLRARVASAGAAVAGGALETAAVVLGPPPAALHAAVEAALYAIGQLAARCGELQVARQEAGAAAEAAAAEAAAARGAAAEAEAAAAQRQRELEAVSRH